MEFVISATSAATATFFIVALIKMYFPTAATWVVGLTVLLGGQTFTFLALVGQGQELTTRAVAGAVLAGVTASASAAGVRSLDNKADSVRTEIETKRVRRAAERRKENE